ncbi:hypothetical protein ACFLWC_05780 [Chloroflexota bacterium]
MSIKIGRIISLILFLQRNAETLAHWLKSTRCQFVVDHCSIQTGITNEVISRLSECEKVIVDQTTSTTSQQGDGWIVFREDSAHDSPDGITKVYPWTK